MYEVQTMYYLENLAAAPRDLHGSSGATPDEPIFIIRRFFLCKTTLDVLMGCVKRGFAIILGILAGVLLLTALAGVLCMNYNLAQIALVEHIEADIEEQVVVVDSVISHQQGLVFNAVECIHQRHLHSRGHAAWHGVAGGEAALQPAPPRDAIRAVRGCGHAAAHPAGHLERLLDLVTHRAPGALTFHPNPELSFLQPAFSLHDFLEGLAAADDLPTVAVHHDLCGQGA